MAESQWQRFSFPIINYLHKQTMRLKLTVSLVPVTRRSPSSPNNNNCYQALLSICIAVKYTVNAEVPNICDMVYMANRACIND